MTEFNNATKALMCLNMAGFRGKKILSLMTYAPIADIVFDSRIRAMAFAKIPVGESLKEKLNDILEKDTLSKAIACYERENIKVVTTLDKEFPQILREIPDAPAILYYKGDISLASSGTLIAVVGSRRYSSYGKLVTENFASEFAKNGITVVSGLAKGLDAVAHKGAIDASGKTIGVLGCGINKIYPAENAWLYGIMQKEHLIISEYPMDRRPEEYNFPERNRLVSGLARGLFVAECGEKSGALITARLAIEQGRNLYVTPANITLETAAGSNKLIKEYPESLVLTPEDIMRDLGMKVIQKKEVTSMLLDVTEAVIADALRIGGEMHFEKLMEITKLTAASLNAILAKMELMQVIQRLDNNYFGVI